MLPLESTTRQVGAGVSGTLKSAETRRILFPFSLEWVTVPVLAFGPWNGPDVCDSRFAAKAPPTSTAASAQTDSKRLSCCTSVLLRFGLVLLLGDLDGMAVRIADDQRFPETRFRIREFNHSARN